MVHWLPFHPCPFDIIFRSLSLFHCPLSLSICMALFTFISFTEFYLQLILVIMFQNSLWLVSPHRYMYLLFAVYRNHIYATDSTSPCVRRVHSHCFCFAHWVVTFQWFLFLALDHPFPICASELMHTYLPAEPLSVYLHVICLAPGLIFPSLVLFSLELLSVRQSRVRPNRWRTRRAAQAE